MFLFFSKIKTRDGLRIMNNSNEDISNSELLKIVLKEIKEEGRDIKASLSNEFKEENHALLGKINKTLGHFEQTYKHISNRLVILDRQLRKNNILIYGIDIPETADLATTVVKTLQELLQLEVNVCELNNIYKLKIGEKYAIKIEFISYLKKDLILKNCYKLKNKNIFIVNDLCFEDRQDQKLLRQHLNLARAENHSAKIQGRYLMVNGEKFSVQSLKNGKPYGCSSSVDEEHHSEELVSFCGARAITTESELQASSENSLGNYFLQTSQPSILHTESNNQVYSSKYLGDETQQETQQNTNLLNQQKVADTNTGLAVRSVEEQTENRSLAVGRERNKEEKKIEDRSKQPKSRSNSNSSVSRVTRQQTTRP